MNSSNINSFVNYNELFTVLDFKAETTGNITTCSCPNCFVNKITVIRDLIYGGYYYHCNSCNFSVDSIELYQQIKRIDSLEIACQAIFTELGKPYPGNISFESYKELRERRKLIQGIIFECIHKDIQNVQSDNIALLERLGLWSGNIETYSKHNNSYRLGLLSWRNFNHLNNFMPLSGLRKSFKGKNCFVIPMEVSPGCPVSLLLWDTNNKKLIKSIVPGVNEGGIAGLESITNSTDAIAVLSPEVYLKLHKSWSSDTTDTLPLIYMPSAHRNMKLLAGVALAYIRNKKIYFVDVRNVDTINYARKLGDNGLVYHADSEDIHDLISQESVHKTVIGIRKKAVSWQRALVEWLLDVTPIEQKLIVQKLIPSLTNDEKRTIDAASSRVEWAKIKYCFDYTPEIKTFMYNGHTFIVREKQGIYRLSKDREELVSEAILELEEATAINSVVYVAGKLKLGENALQFTEKESVLRSNAVSWITNKCIAFGVIPTIAAKYSKYILDLSYAYKKPVVTKPLEKIGFNPQTKKIVFPGFNIDEFGTIEYKTFANSLLVPGSELKNSFNFPGIVVVDKLLTKSPHTEMILGLMVVVISNLLCNHFDYATKGLLVNTPTDTWNRVCSFFGSKLGLTSINKTITTAEGAEAVANAEHQCDLPVVIRNNNLTTKHWRTWLNYMGPRNCIITCDNLSLVNLIQKTTWFTLSGADDLGDETAFEVTLGNIFDMIPLTISYILKNKNKFVADFPIEYNVIKGIKDYILTGHPNADLSIFEKLGTHLSTSPADVWGRVIWLCAFMLDTEHKGIPEYPKQLSETELKSVSKNMEPVYKGDNSIILVWDGIQKKARKYGIDVPDIDVLESAVDGQRVKHTALGWEIDLPYWNMHLNTFKSL